MYWDSQKFYSACVHYIPLFYVDVITYTCLYHEGCLASLY